VPLKPYEIYLKLPGFNCGACDSWSCIAFARKLAAGKASVEFCPFLREKAEIEAIAKVAEIPKPVSNKNAALIKPCVNDSEKLMGEVQLALADGEQSIFGFFDILTMKYLLGLKYLDLKFSYKLGSAKFQMQDGSKALVFENGYISLRELSSARAFDENIIYLAKLLWGALVCPRCASAALECTCSISVRPTVIAKFSKKGARLEQLNLLKVLKENSSSRDKLINLFLDELLDKDKQELDKQELELAALWLISLAWHLHRAMEAKPQAEAEAEAQVLLQQAWDLIENFDSSKCRALLRESEMYRYRVLKHIDKSCDKSLIIIKSLIIANSAFYIASSFSKFNIIDKN
jgi:ArsR family metal-binding transcriptional regulator